MTRELTEKEVRRIAREEMNICFDEIQSDVKEIKTALLGDAEYSRKGIVTQVNDNTDYIERNKTLEAVPRSLKVVEWFDMDGSNDKTKVLDLMINDYKHAKWVFGVLIGTGVINISMIAERFIQFIISK